MKRAAALVVTAAAVATLAACHVPPPQPAPPTGAPSVGAVLWHPFRPWYPHKLPPSYWR